MGVLVLTTVLPGGQRGGGEIVTQSIVEALAGTGQEVRVLGYMRPTDRGPERDVEVCVGRRPIETSEAGWRSLGWMARAVATGTSYSVAKFRSRGYLRRVRAALREEPQAVLVDHAGIGFATRALEAGHPPLVFVAHNAEAELYARLAREAAGPARRWAHAREARLIGRGEAALARRADQVWTLTAADADHFRALAPGSDVRTLAAVSRIDEPESLDAPERDVALIGTWSWEANSRGLEWFADEVVPRLDGTLAVEVAGAGAGWLRGRHPSVTVRGVVPDAPRFLSGARVVAVPSTVGAGVQVKTLDAIASGVPVVATPLAVRGLGELPSSVAVAEAPAEFAGALARLARHADRDRLRADAVAWSRARRERFDAAVAGWVGELQGASGERVPAALAARSGRSSTRPA